MFEGTDLLITLIAGRIVSRQVLHRQAVREQILSSFGTSKNNIYIPRLTLEYSFID